MVFQSKICLVVATVVTESIESIFEMDQEAVRRARLAAIRKVVELLQAKADDNDAATTVDEVLNSYSEFAALSDPAAGECLGYYDFRENAIDNFNDTPKEKRRKGIVNFFVDLSARNLYKGAVSEAENGAGQVASWEEYTEWEDILPNNTDFQRCIPEMKLWEFGFRDERPEPEFQAGPAHLSTDFGVEDKGNVLWKLEAISSGFPVGGVLQETNGISILREQHRQVMFNAFSWLLRNAASLCLTVENRTDPRPKSVIAAVCGSSGIGKSRSLIFLLWFLLKKKSPFLLEAGTEDHRYFCLIRPRAQTVKFITKEQAIDILVTDQSVLGVVDPKQFREEEKPVLSGLLNAVGVVCWTASANPYHLPRADKESHRVMKFWVSPWILSHLQAACPFFNDKLSVGEVEQRFSVVGGVPRAIIKADVFKARNSTITEEKIDDSIAQDLFDALLRQKDSEKMSTKVPQAFLAFYSAPPFIGSSPGCIRVDFLSQQGRLRAGHLLYKSFRTQLAKERDDSGAGMFFERWVGTLLAAGNNAQEFLPFRLREFTKEGEANKDIKIPAAGNVLEYASEDLLIDHLQKQGHVENSDELFPSGRVRQPPYRTPVYDFAISPRWLVQVTLAKMHPIPKAHLQRLVRMVGATTGDPLHLVFFVFDEDCANEYSKRGGEKYDGEVAIPDIKTEVVQELKKIANGEYLKEKVESIARILSLTVTKPAKKRQRVTKSLGSFETRDCPLPPYVLLGDIMAKLRLVKTGSIEEKWQRLVGFVTSLHDDESFKDMQFDKNTVKQHVITLVPYAPSQQIVRR